METLKKHHMNPKKKKLVKAQDLARKKQRGRRG